MPKHLLPGFFTFILFGLNMKLTNIKGWIFIINKYS